MNAIKEDIVLCAGKETYKVTVARDGMNDSLRVFSKRNGRDEWQTVSLALDLISYAKQFFTGSWPPENCSRAEIVDGALMVEFEDPWQEWEKPIMPFKLDVESSWSATLSARSGKWRLQRISFINYEKKS